VRSSEVVVVSVFVVVLSRRDVIVRRMASLVLVQDRALGQGHQRYVPVYLTTCRYLGTGRQIRKYESSPGKTKPPWSGTGRQAWSSEGEMQGRKGAKAVKKQRKNLCSNQQLSSCGLLHSSMFFSCFPHSRPATRHCCCVKQESR
jgi:hypothetical protein